MSRYILCMTLLALIASGCDDEPRSQPHPYVSAEAKPKVSIVPIIDHTKTDYNWSLSDELSSSIYNRIAEKDQIALNKVSLVRNKIRQMNQNPFGSDLSWVKNVFLGDQFAVFLELVKHEEVPRRNRKTSAEEQDCSADLNISVRVRAVDLRGEEPRIVLQELIENSYYVPRPFTQFNFYQASWGDESYAISPLGIAHASLTKEISRQIEDYIVRASKQ